jgi:hypothetical protein
VINKKKKKKIGYLLPTKVYPVTRLITYPTKRDYNKWFLSLYPTKVRLKTIGRRYHFNKFIFNRLIIIYIMIASYFNVTKLNSIKFIQNSSNINLETTKRKYI